MELKHVVEELRQLNKRGESDSGVLDDIRHYSAKTVNSLDSLVDAISGQIKADMKFNRDEALRRRQEAIKAGRKGGGSKSKGEEDGLLASLIGFGIALQTNLFAVGAALLFAANKYATQFDDVMTETQLIIERIRETIVFLGAALGTPVLKHVARLPFRIVSAVFNGIIAAIRSNKFHSAIIDAIKGNFTKIKRMPVFNMFNRFVSSVSKVAQWIVKLGRFLPGFNILTRIGGLLLKTIGRAFPIFNVILIALDGIMGGFRAWQEGGDWLDIVLGAIQGVVDGFINLFRDIGSFFGWITEKILIFMGVNEETAARVREVINNVFNSIANVVEGVTLFFRGIQQDIYRWIGRLINSPNEVINNALGRIGDVLGDTLNAVGSFMLRAIKAFAADTLRMTAGLIPDIPGVRRAKNALLNLADRITSEGMMDMGRDVFNAAANAASGVVAAGRAAVDGSMSEDQRAAITAARNARGNGPRGGSQEPQTEEPITSPQSALSADEIGQHIPSQNFVTVMDNSSQSTSVSQQDNRSTLVSAPASARNGSYASFIRGS